MYSPNDALEVLNSHFFVGKNNQETAIFRINVDGSATFCPTRTIQTGNSEHLRLCQALPLAAVRSSTSPPKNSGEKAPGATKGLLFSNRAARADPYEFNLWRGFGVEPRKGWQKQRRLLRHIREVICRRDKRKFKYFIRYLAWAVQNPDKHAGVIIVLKSAKQGTGKSSLGKVMLDIFGHHGALIDDKERLLGRFTDWVETICFVLLEEILWAGDHKSADKLKSLITGDTIQIERKFGSCRQIPNRLKAIATTNHDHAIAAGVQDRRNVVYDVSDERVGDRAWFDRLYQDLAAGGTSEFLYFLQNLRLGNWHPRDILKTAETAEQQRMSSDSVSQWSQACIDADAIIGAGQGQSDLAKPISSEELRQAYNGFCKQNSLRTLSTEGFGKACTEMFGPRRRLPSQGSGIKHRPWGYDVPNGDTWQAKIDARLGIQHSELAGSAAVKRATLCFDPDKFPKQPIPPEGMESLAEGLSEYLGE